MKTVVVGGTEFVDHFPPPEVWGGADDGVGFGPGCEQGIACGDDVVEVVQWEDLLLVVVV